MSKVYENLLHPASMPCFGGQGLGKGSWLSQVMRKSVRLRAFAAPPRSLDAPYWRLRFAIHSGSWIYGLFGVEITIYPGLRFTVCLGVRIYDVFGVLNSRFI